MIPPPPKAYWRLIHVIQTSRVTSAAATTENRNAKNRDMEHRKGRVRLNHGQSCDATDNVEHGIGHPASIVFAVTAESDFRLFVTLLLHSEIARFNICVQLVYGRSSFVFRQTKEAML